MTIEKIKSMLNGAAYGFLRTYEHLKGRLTQAFFEMVKNFEKRTAYAAKHTELPEQPDLRRIEEFVVSVNYRAAMRA